MGNNGMLLDKSPAMPDISCGVWPYTSKGLKNI